MAKTKRNGKSVVTAGQQAMPSEFRNLLVGVLVAVVVHAIVTIVFSFREAGITQTRLESLEDSYSSLSRSVITKDLFESRSREVDSRFSAMGEKISALRSEMISRFDNLDKRLDERDKRLEERFAALEDANRQLFELILNDKKPTRAATRETEANFGRAFRHARGATACTSDPPSANTAVPVSRSVAPISAR